MQVPSLRLAAELLSWGEWHRNYNEYLSSSSVAGTANSDGHSPFRVEPTKCASIVEGSLLTIVLTLSYSVQQRSNELISRFTKADTLVTRVLLPVKKRPNQCPM